MFITKSDLFCKRDQRTERETGGLVNIVEHLAAKKQMFPSGDTREQKQRWKISEIDLTDPETSRTSGLIEL